MSKRSEVVYINGAPSTPSYLLALLRELSHVLRGLTEIAEAKQVRKTNQSGILYQSKKSRSLRFEPKISLISFSRGSGPPLIIMVDPNEINEILGSKREDRLSDHFFELVQNTTLVRFSYLLRV